MRRIPSLAVLACWIYCFGLAGNLDVGSDPAMAQEIGFLEEFSLSENRAEILKRLVPGTERYYFFHCLHYQNMQQLAKVDELLKPWIKRFGYTQQVNQIRNRQALLKYGDDPRETLDFLTQQLNLNFNHQREIPQTQRDLPTEFDAGLTDPDRLAAQAMQRYQNSDGFTESGLPLLASKTLSQTQLRHLLQRLRYPDFPGLVDLIVRDLKERDSGGFGRMPIHTALTLNQLDDLASKLPKVANQTNFVNLYLAKLYPSDDTNWRADIAEHQKYLDRLWKYAQQLGPVHNSLKACILFRKLDLNRMQARFDRELFITYLKLPKNVGYINQELVRNTRNRSHIVNLNENFSNRISLAPIRNDEPLVRDYLHHFLLQANDATEFQPFVESKYLDRQFATVKILNGLGDSEKWASMLSPEQYQQLMERVDLDFLPTNPVYFQPVENVELELYLKNVKTMIVKVFEINTENYYRKHNSEVDTNINLDGLVPNFEQTFTYNDEPALRVKRTFKFPEIDKRGVYVVDFIASGKSSRALIRKGRLQIVSQTTAVGQLLTVLDREGQIVRDASLWVAGKRYQPNDEGRILLPFSTQPGLTSVIISQGDFSCLQAFDHVAEKYQFTAAMVMDRESLNRSNRAKILLRPSLRIAAGNAVPISLLKQSKLVITSLNQDDISSTKIVSDLELYDTKETVCEFVVPPRLKQLDLTLSAQIENVSLGKLEPVTATQSFMINQIDQSNIIQDLHLAPTESGYFLEVLGKTGEPRGKQAVRLAVKVAGFKDTVDVDLQSDQDGRIGLGQLQNVESITAKLAGGSSKTWQLSTEDQTYPETINSLSGEPITIAAPAGLTRADESRISLFSRHRGAIVASFFDNVSVRDGLITIQGLQPGDYLLRLNDRADTNASVYKSIVLRVTAGKQSANALVGKHRQLEKRASNPLQITSLEVKGEQITVQLANARPGSRVHIMGTRYQPAFNAFSSFSKIKDIEPWSYRPSVRRSVYMQGRKIGDEYQYILDRKYATKYPGNMLQRPSLLLNPWASKTTDNRAQDVAKGDEFGMAGNEPDSKSERKQSTQRGTAGNTDFANLDFLGNNAWLVANLVPDENGQVILNRDQIGSAQHIRVIALDANTTCQRNLNLPLQSFQPRDGRLANVLDAQGHFLQRKRIEILKPGDQLLIDDIVSAKFQYYDDLNDVYRLLTTLNPDTSLGKFEFILTWLDKNDDEKRELYSQYACHELNFFLANKDPEFFKDVVVGHLANKREKTFLDRWLLDENLDVYTKPWQYARLNTVERILLSQRLENRASDIIRNVTELYMLTPTSRARFDVLYDTTIRGLSLDDNLTEEREELLERFKDLPKLGQGGRRGRGTSDRSRDDGITTHSNRGGGGGGGGLGGKPGAGTATELNRNMDGALMATDEFGVEESRESTSLGLSDKEKSVDRLSLQLQEQARATGMMIRLGGVAPAEVQAPALAVPAPQNENMYGYFSARELTEFRRKSEALYRRLQPTQEWMENHYYQLLPEQQTAELVTPNRFWRDYANHEGGSFLSPYFSEAHENFTEIMFALAVLDLPMKAPEQNLDYVDSKMTFAPVSSTIAFHQQVQDALVERGNTTILVSENFFQANDRYRFQDGVRFDKFISDEFNAHTLYGGQVVITNPTSTPRAVDLLIQIPQGSVACTGSQSTETIQLDLQAFSTKTFEYFFYFPTAGQFSHYPAHVSAEEKVLAIADPVGFVVTDRPAEVDKSSWQYVSQNGDPDEVIDFLNQQNVLRLNLERIAFRMKDQEFFQRALETLRNRYVYNHTLWSYSVKHDDLNALQEFLTHADAIATQCGPYFESEVLNIDPIDRNWYQHREYWPLTNARSHRLGPQRKILNPDFFQQYQELLSILAHRRKLDDEHHLVVTYYMLLQDRIEQALRHFDATELDRLNSKVQYAYCDAYLDMYRGQPESAATKAGVWIDYPVDHWRNRFKNILAQFEEISGVAAQAVDENDPAQTQDELAAQAESFDFEVEAGVVKVKFQNLANVTVNYYEMDIELLFSRSPFAQDELDGFSMIRPNLSHPLRLDAGRNVDGIHEFNLPDQFQNKNILVELVAGDQAKSQPYFAHALDVQIVENYGNLQVTEETTRKPIAKAYVKVYSRMEDGSVGFLKDGYTDLRGRFDYVSQSNRSLDGIQKLAVLVLSEDQGAIIRQASPPKE